MHIICVGNLSAVALSLLHTREHSLERSFINVITVKRPLLGAFTLFHTREHTLARNPVKVMMVANLFSCDHNLLCISEPILGKRKFMNAVIVENLLNGDLSSLFIRGHTLERSPMTILTVEKPSVVDHILKNTREHIPEKNPIHALTVGKPSVINHLLENTEEYTLKRNPMKVTTVGSLFISNHSLLCMSEPVL